MSSSWQRFVVAAGVLCLFLLAHHCHAQPLLREGDPQQEDETDPETLRRQALARQKAALEEEQRMKTQQELMRLQGEQMLADREKIERTRIMMRYALIIAVAVIATTLLIAYARSRVHESRDHLPRD